jgi:hypothetical protein
MKIIKMPDKATEQFDRFVQQQLNQVDIDLSRADDWANNMKFPVAVEPEMKQGWKNRFFGGNRKYFSLLLLLLFFGGATTVIINNKNSHSEKRIKTSNEPRQNNTPPNVINNNVLNEKTRSRENNVGANNNIQEPTPERINDGGLDGGKIKKDKDAPSTDNKNTALVSDKGDSPIPLNNPQKQMVTSIPDSSTAVRTPEKKHPEKKDTIHVIW